MQSYSMIRGHAPPQQKEYGWTHSRGCKKNSHHLEFQSAFQETHRIVAADPFAPLTSTDSQQQDTRFKFEPSDHSGLAERGPKGEKIWQSRSSDDSKWNAWSFWSQDDWRVAQSQSHVDFSSNLPETDGVYVCV